MGAINAAAWRRRSLTMAKYFLPEWFVHQLKVSQDALQAGASGAQAATFLKNPPSIGKR